MLGWSLQSITQIAASLAVFVGVIFGALTIVQWHRTRYLTSSLELVRTIQTVEFTRSIGRVLELPIDADPKMILTDREMTTAVYAITHVFESLGALVFDRLLPLHLVDRVLGGYVRTSWKRVKPYVIAQRSVVGPVFGEWFQWLAERMEEHPAPGKSVGAPEAYRTWKP